MSDIDFNELDKDVGCLLCQAIYVMREIDGRGDAHSGLTAFLESFEGKVLDALDAANKDAEAALDTLEECSVSFAHALALHQAILGDSDDPSFEAVATLLRSAKRELDNMNREIMAGRNAKLRDVPAKPEDQSPPAAAAQRAFMAGVELARKMMDAADGLSPGAAEIEAQHRGGAQADFALPFLVSILQCPTLLPGFSAVVSFVFGTDRIFTSQNIPKTYEEIVGAPVVAASTAIKEIESMEVQVRHLADTFNADGRLVDVLDHAADLYKDAAGTGSVDDVRHMLTTAESFLHAAWAIALDPEFNNAAFAELLTSVKEKADRLTSKFDVGGEYFDTQEPAAQVSPAAPTQSTRKAVAA